MFGLNVAWRLIGECVQSYHFLDTRQNRYIVDSNFCLEIQWTSMVHIFDSHKQRKCCEKLNILSVQIVTFDSSKKKITQKFKTEKEICENLASNEICM
jgi:hypothetical protein